MARQQAERFTIREQIQRVNLQSGAAQGLTSLAASTRIGDATVNMLIDRYRKKRFAEEEQAGLAAFEPGQSPQFKDENRIIGGEASAAYNKGLRHAYIASLSNDIRNDLANFEIENSDNFEGYQSKVESYRAALNQEVDPTVRAAVLQSFDEQSTTGGIRVRKAEVERVRTEQINSANEHLSTLTVDILNAARNGESAKAEQSAREMALSLQSAVDSKLITQEEANKKINEIQAASTVQEQIGIVERIAAGENGVINGQNYIEEVEAREFPGMTPEQKDAMVRNLTAQVTQVATRKSRELTNRSAETTRLARSLIVEAGQPGADAAGIMSKADSLLDDNLISGTEWGQIASNLQKGITKEQEEVVQLQAVNNRLDGDKSQIVDQKQVDLYYDNYLSDAVAEIQNPYVRNATVAAYVEGSRHIPTEYKQQVKNDIASGDPQLVIRAVDFIDQIDTIPGIDPYESFSVHDRAFAQQVLALSKNMEPEQAVHKAFELTDTRNAAIVEARERDIKEFNSRTSKQYIDWTKDIRKEFNVREGGVNESDITKEYRETVEALYKGGMDIDAAKKSVLSNIGTNWKEDLLTGRTYKYPVSDYIDDMDLARKDLLRYVTENNLYSFEVQFDDIHLLSDDRTAREASLGQPSYIAFVINPGNGEFIHFPKSRWEPPYTEAGTFEPNDIVQQERRKSRASLIQNLETWTPSAERRFR